MSNSWKKYAKLRTKKYRQEWRLFLVEGTRLCKEALRSDWEIEAAFLSESFAEKAFDNHWKRLFRERTLTYRVLGDSNFRRLADTQNPQGILLVLRMKPLPPNDHERFKGKNFILILDGIQDPGNIIKELQQRNFTVISSTPQAETSVHSLQVKPPLAFILGSEAHGVSPEIQQLATITVSIPRHGEAESLNVAVAGGILMYHFSSIIYSEKSKHGRKYPDNLPAEKSPERGKK
ncbi:hypothetical protein B1H10_04935 [candidate division KSB1 bacterium 4484_188]|nr:MAG: hypothetical protein B1H10_04935 [candidate division KSB1 bacterium 4484_188]